MSNQSFATWQLADAEHLQQADCRVVRRHACTVAWLAQAQSSSCSVKNGMISEQYIACQLGRLLDTAVPAAVPWDPLSCVYRCRMCQLMGSCWPADPKVRCGGTDLLSGLPVQCTGFKLGGCLYLLGHRPSGCGVSSPLQHPH